MSIEEGEKRGLVHTFNNPSVILQCDNTGKPDSVEGPTDMPVEYLKSKRSVSSHICETGEATDYSRSVSRHDLVNKAYRESNQQGHRLFLCSNCTGLSTMKRADCVCLIISNVSISPFIRERLVTYCCGRGRESQLLVNDIVLSQWDNEKDAEKPSTSCQCNNLSDVLLGKRRQKVKTVHGRDGADGKDTKTPRGYRKNDELNVLGYQISEEVQPVAALEKEKKESQFCTKSSKGGLTYL